jgi:D-alanine-D-alanine ligase
MATRAFGLCCWRISEPQLLDPNLTTAMTQDPSKRRVAVSCGGYSGEADISRASAAMVMDHIDRDRFEPVLVHIERGGWTAEWDAPKHRAPVDRGNFTTTAPDGSVVGFDIVLEMVHGTPGEDGQLGAYFALFDLPYTGSPTRTMAVGHHKAWTKDLLSRWGYPVAPSVTITAEDRELHADDFTAWAHELAEQIGLPCFIKGNQSGSSIGVTRVESVEQFPAAFDAAFAASATIMVEAFLSGREFTCGVIPSSPGGAPVALPVTEITTANLFFDYQAKYEGQSEEVTPADIDEAATSQIQQTALDVYCDMDMCGVARVDFIMHDGVANIVEVNTVPGFSAASIIPQQAAEAGLQPREFISLLLDDAWARSGRSYPVGQLGQRL